MNDLFGITDCICPVCEKKFERLSPDWTYKITLGGGRFNYFCSYSCWTEALESKQVYTAQARSFRLSPEQKQEMFSMLDEGIPQDVIAKKLKVSNQLVHYYRKKRP